MVRFRFLVLAVSLLAVSVSFSADSPEQNTFSESILIDAIEKGHSLVVAKVVERPGPNPDSSSPDLSDQAKRNVPDLLERLASGDPVVGFKLVDELLVVEHMGDVMWTSLRYDLSPSDYSIILQCVVPRVVDGLSNPQSAASVLERLWWTMKYEGIYLKDYQHVDEALCGIGGYFRFSNRRQLHQPLGYRTLAEV